MRSEKTGRLLAETGVSRSRELSAKRGTNLSESKNNGEGKNRDSEYRRGDDVE
jgi:hypothetical protein